MRFFFIIFKKQDMLHRLLRAFKIWYNTLNWVYTEEENQKHAYHLSALSGRNRP